MVQVLGPTISDPPPPLSAAGDLALVAAYQATTWRVRTPTGTLPLRIGERFALPNLAVVTAWNPASMPRSRESNRDANRRLLAELLRHKLDVCPAVALGVGDDAGAWREPGFAIRGLDLASAISVGERYEQNAIVWVTATGIPTLVVTRNGFAGRPVGSVL